MSVLRNFTATSCQSTIRCPLHLEVASCFMLSLVIRANSVSRYLLPNHLVYPAQTHHHMPLQRVMAPPRTHPGGKRQHRLRKIDAEVYSHLHSSRWLGHPNCDGQIAQDCNCGCDHDYIWGLFVAYRKLVQLLSWQLLICNCPLYKTHQLTTGNSLSS